MKKRNKDKEKRKKKKRKKRKKEKERHGGLKTKEAYTHRELDIAPLPTHQFGFPSCFPARQALKASFPLCVQLEFSRVRASDPSSLQRYFSARPHRILQPSPRLSSELPRTNPSFSALAFSSRRPHLTVLRSYFFLFPSSSSLFIPLHTDQDR